MMEFKVVCAIILVICNVLDARHIVKDFGYTKKEFIEEDEIQKVAGECIDRFDNCADLAAQGLCTRDMVNEFMKMKMYCCASCAAIDPCRINKGGCSQVCKNQDGLASCSCKKRFKLQMDWKTCEEDCTDKSRGCTTWYGKGFCEESSKHYQYVTSQCCETCRQGSYVQVNQDGCWGRCGEKGGSCPNFCGKDGFCCRKGWADCSVDMAAVSPKYHTCVVPGEVQGSHTTA